jgi:hypothetical protein
MVMVGKQIRVVSNRMKWMPNGVWPLCGTGQVPIRQARRSYARWLGVHFDSPKMDKKGLADQNMA